MLCFRDPRSVVRYPKLSVTLRSGINQGESHKIVFSDSSKMLKIRTIENSGLLHRSK